MNKYAGNTKDLIAFVDYFGPLISASGMFGCDTVEQAKILAMQFWSENTSPFEQIEKYNLIYGKPAMKAEAMHCSALELGCEVEVKERTSSRAAIEITRNAKTQKFSLSWEEAKDEPFVYVGKEKEILAKLARGEKPKLKAKYATPRSRMQMLSARVVSDGVRVMAPEATRTNYTPEEISDFVELDENEEAGNTAGVVEKTESVETKVPAKAEPKSESTQTESEPKGDPPPPADAFEEETDGPISAELMNQIKSAAKEMSQVTGEKYMHKVKTFLDSKGVKLADISRLDGIKLLSMIREKTLGEYLSNAGK